MWHKKITELTVTINETTLTLSLHNKQHAMLSLENHELIDGMIYKFTRIITFINQTLQDKMTYPKTMDIILAVDPKKIATKHHRLVLQYLLLSKEINITMTGIYLADPYDKEQNLLSLFTPNTTALKKWSALGSLMALVLLVPLFWLVATHQKNISNRTGLLLQHSTEAERLIHNQAKLAQKKESLSLLETKNKKNFVWHTNNQSIIKTIASTAQTMPKIMRLETLDIQATETPHIQQILLAGQAGSMSDVTIFHHQLSIALSNHSFLVTSSHNIISHQSPKPYAHFIITTK